MSLFPIAQTYYTKGIDGSYIDGEYVEATWSDALTFYGTIQPMTDQEAESFDSGQRLLGGVKIYTTTNFNISEEGGKIGDLVLFDGKYFQCRKKDTYKSGLLTHNKYLATYYPEGVS